MSQQAKALSLTDNLEQCDPSKVCLKEAAQELRRLHNEVQQMALAEEGAKEAFGHVVQSKRDLATKCKELTQRQQHMNTDMRLLIHERDRLAAVVAGLKNRSNV